jgi:hypothetical protein
MEGVGGGEDVEVVEYFGVSVVEGEEGEMRLAGRAMDVKGLDAGEVEGVGVAAGRWAGDLVSFEDAEGGEEEDGGDFAVFGGGELFGMEEGLAGEERDGGGGVVGEVGRHEVWGRWILLLTSDL